MRPEKNHGSAVEQRQDVAQFDGPGYYHNLEITITIDAFEASYPDGKLKVYYVGAPISDRASIIDASNIPTEFMNTLVPVISLPTNTGGVVTIRPCAAGLTDELTLSRVATEQGFVAQGAAPAAAAVATPSLADFFNNNTAVATVTSPTRSRRVVSFAVENGAAAPAAACATTPAQQQEATTREQRSNQLTHVKQLGPHTHEMTRNRTGDKVCVYKLPREKRYEAIQMIDWVEYASRHPGAVMGMLATKHRDGSVDIEVELCDGGTLARLIRLMKEKADVDRVSIAKSVAHQLVDVLLYYHIVHGVQHGNIRPEEILLRRDGCVKLTPFNCLAPDEVAANPNKYRESPFVSPQKKEQDEVKKFLENDQCDDVWSVGMILLAIIMGEDLGYPKKPKNPENENEYEKKLEAYNIAAGRIMHFVSTATPQAWKELIPDATLRYFIQRCLQSDIKKRASLAELNALIWLFSEKGITDNTNPNNPVVWPFPLNGPAVEARQDLELAGPEIKRILTSSAIHIQIANDGRDVVLNDAAADALRTIMLLVTLENQSWKHLRELPNRSKTAVEKEMREVVTARQVYAREKMAPVVVASIPPKPSNSNNAQAAAATPAVVLETPVARSAGAAPAAASSAVVPVVFPIPTTTFFANHNSAVAANPSPPTHQNDMNNLDDDGPAESRRRPPPQ